MSQVVGIDIGGTKTHVVVAPDDESLQSDSREIVVPSSTWRRALGDFDADAKGLRELLVTHFGAEVLAGRIVVGAHGCENTAQCRALEDALSALVEGPVLVVNDSELIPPAMGADNAIGVVVGTGSIATARSAGGELVGAGGWGWLLGDEGSAPGLVREAAKAVLYSLDSGGTLDPLVTRLLAAFAAQDGAELALALTETGSAEGWGAHAREIFEAADEGSTLAVGVIQDSGEHLARLVHQLLDRGIPAEAVVAGGSVIQGQPRLQQAFGSALERRGSGVTLTILDRAPVLGALALARGLTRGPNDHILRIGDR